LVDLAAAVNRGLEWQQERAQPRWVWRTLEDLSHSQQAALPGALAGQRGGDAGAKSTDRGDPVASGGEPIRLCKKVRRRVRPFDALDGNAAREPSARGAEDDECDAGHDQHAD